MPNYHFRIKSDKRPNGKQTSAHTHCEYIQREGRYAELGNKELESLSYNNLITGKYPIENLPESELLLYSSPYGKILVDKSGVRFMRQSTLSEETIAMGIEIARKIYGDELELKGRSRFVSKAMATAVKLEVPVTWSDEYQNKVMAIMKEDYENGERDFREAGGKYIRRRIADPRKQTGRGRGKRDFPEPHAKLDTLEALAKRGFSLPKLPQCHMVRPEGRNQLLLSRDENNHLLNKCRESTAHLRWYSLRARRRAIDKTVNDIMVNFQKNNDAVYASSHVQYINRESIFKKRGGCLYTANHLPRWAEGNAKKFFQAADRFERINGERYKEMEFSLPNELGLEENKKIVEEFVQKHLQDFYYAYAIHDKIGAMSDGERQPHVHIMFSPREIDEVERQQERPPKLFFSRANTKNPEKGGCAKSWKWNSADRQKYLMRLRKDCARIQNEALEKNGVNLRVDHRTIKAQREEALANGNYWLADLLNKVPEKYLGPVDPLNDDNQRVQKLKSLRVSNHQREQSIISRLMIQDGIDKDTMEEKSQDMKQRQEVIFAYEPDIEDADERAYFTEEKQKIQEMEKDMVAVYGITIWAPKAVEMASLDAMTTEEKELWQDLKSYGREKKEWEILKNRMVEPPGDDVEALEAYLKICPEIDKELDKINLKIHQAAAEIRPVFERLNLPHNKASILKRAAFYVNDNRLAKTEIRKLQRNMDSKLKSLDKHIKDYFAVRQKNREYSVEEVASILNANIARQVTAEKRLAKELYHMRKRVISYPRAIEMAKNNYVQGAFKQLRADKRELKKREDKLSPEDRNSAWQEIDRREQELEARCSTAVGRSKIEAIAAGILRKNAPIAKEYNMLSAKHRALKDSIIQIKYQSQRVEARAPLEQGNKFRVAPSAQSSSSGGGGGSLPTPSRDADLISKALSGGAKEAQLVARSKPDEPDDWKWLSEAEKDDLRNDMATIDRY
ncbi:MobA/MobL family protein [Selenomonas sp. AE3005]|uniref:MobA/MobL family protein n=1 Tax=Selenomonas sp. AE3005 TaxID=1485543 RepID=UPI00068C77C8|nr:MobA/MobL family protein [Selenomonas sp. AE3005]